MPSLFYNMGEEHELRGASSQMGQREDQQDETKPCQR